MGCQVLQETMMKRSLTTPTVLLLLTLISAPSDALQPAPPSVVKSSVMRADNSIASQFQRDTKATRGLFGTPTMQITFDDDSVLLFDLVQLAPHPRYSRLGSKAERAMRSVRNFDLSPEGFTITFADGSTSHFDLSRSVSTKLAN
jgi:hypothetical protein